MKHNWPSELYRKSYWTCTKCCEWKRTWWILKLHKCVHIFHNRNLTCLNSWKQCYVNLEIQATADVQPTHMMFWVMEHYGQAVTCVCSVSPARQVCSNRKLSYSNFAALYEQTISACTDIHGPSKTDNKRLFQIIATITLLLSFYKLTLHNVPKE